MLQLSKKHTRSCEMNALPVCFARASAPCGCEKLPAQYTNLRASSIPSFLDAGRKIGAMLLSHRSPGHSVPPCLDLKSQRSSRPHSSPLHRRPLRHNRRLHHLLPARRHRRLRPPRALVCQQIALAAGHQVIAKGPRGRACLCCCHRGLVCERRVLERLLGSMLSCLAVLLNMHHTDDECE